MHDLEMTFQLPQFTAGQLHRYALNKGLTKLSLLFSKKQDKVYVTISTLDDLKTVNDTITDYLNHTKAKQHNINLRIGKPARMTINWDMNTIRFH